MPTIEEDLRFLITELQEERTNTGDELATGPIPGTFGEAWIFSAHFATHACPST